MPVQWKRTADVLDDREIDWDYTALEGDEVVGRVYRIPSGLWFWMMTADRPGPRRPHAATGREDTLRNAVQRVVEAYEGLPANAGTLTKRNC